MYENLYQEIRSRLTLLDAPSDRHTPDSNYNIYYTFTVIHPLYYLGLNRRYEIYQDQFAFEG